MPSLPSTGCSPYRQPTRRFVNPQSGEPPTGEPCAGDPHARFGGGRDRELNRSFLPLSVKPTNKKIRRKAKAGAELLSDGQALEDFARRVALGEPDDERFLSLGVQPPGLGVRVVGHAIDHIRQPSLGGDSPGVAGEGAHRPDAQHLTSVPVGRKDEGTPAMHLFSGVRRRS